MVAAVDSSMIGIGDKAQSRRIAIFPLAVCLLGSAAAWSEPLNLFDPTPRTVYVQFETSTDPAAIGQTYSAPYEATYSVAGNIGTVMLSGSTYESAIETRDLDYFDALTAWTLVDGSASDFTLEIDLTTLEATAQTVTYDVTVPFPFPQIGTVTRDLGTSTTAGYAFLPEYPGFPFFCDTCLLVPGAAYNPATGEINAVGSDNLVSPDVDLTSFARAGDMRLSEASGFPLPGLAPTSLLALAVALGGLAGALTRNARASN